MNTQPTPQRHEAKCCKPQHIATPAIVGNVWERNTGIDT